jgi:hypothetical protein
MFMNLASGSVGEFVLVVCRNRIAEHQRVNDPDCTWLHCLTPHVRWTAPRERAPRTHRANCCRVAERAHRANRSRPQGKLPCAHVRAASARVAPSLWRCEDRTDKRLRGGETKKWPRCATQKQQRGPNQQAGGPVWDARIGINNFTPWPNQRRARPPVPPLSAA